MLFDRHDAKHDRNLRERGFGFDFAALIVEGRVLSQADDRHDYGEVRIRAIGDVDGIVLVVVYTDRARPRVDRARVEATTEAETAEQMIEDGENPQADPGPFVEDWQPARIRARLGMSQIEFAAALAIPVATLRIWEQGRVRPDPAARALLRIVAREPGLALAAMKAVG